jgi:lysozyme
VTQVTPRQKAGAGAAAIAAAFAIVAPLLMRSEGYVPKPYADPVGIKTVCWGHTGSDIASRPYTKAECTAILERDFAAHAEGVAACVPTITDARHTFAYAAAVDFAFNSGVRTMCRSSMARLMNQGRWTEGCQAFLLYRFAGKPPRVLKGLLIRRQEEVKLCLRG